MASEPLPDLPAASDIAESGPELGRNHEDAFEPVTQASPIKYRHEAVSAHQDGANHIDNSYESYQSHSSIPRTQTAQTALTAQIVPTAPTPQTATVAQTATNATNATKIDSSDYLHGIMAEVRKLEGRLSTLLDEHSKVRDENEDLRSQPQPDAATLQDLETLTTKYNKVKKLYFQREQQNEELNKEMEDLKAERDELNRDLDILTKDRDALNAEAETLEREKESLRRQCDTIARERDAILREKDAVVRERDTIAKVKDEAIHDKQEAFIERDDAKQERERLEIRVRDLQDEVSSARAQAQNALANGVHSKRQSAPPTSGVAGTEHPQEILRLKYDKVKRLYYEQQKTISNLEENLRHSEAGRSDDTTSSRRDSIIWRSNSKGKQRASYVSPERDSYRGEGSLGRSDSVDSAPPQRRRSTRTGRQGASLDRNSMSGDTFVENE